MFTDLLPAVDAAVTAPAILLAAALIMLLIGQTRLYTRTLGYVLTTFALLGALATMQVGATATHPVYGELFNGMLVYDAFAAIFVFMFLAGGVLTLAVSRAFIFKNTFFTSESFVMFLFALFGMIVLSMSNELLTALIALEIASMSVYILVGLNRTREYAAEAFFKYLVIGSFMASFYLLGLLLIYVQTGTTQIDGIALFVQSHPLKEQALVIFGGMLLIAFILFKIAALPFGVWVLDVYEGASMPITAFMAGVFKIAVFSLALRLLLIDFTPFKGYYDTILLMIAIFTLLGGSLFAVAQSSVKRMLAASSIVHSGYLLIALIAANESDSVAAPAILFYLVAYFISSIGAFGVLGIFSGGVDKTITYEDLKGRARDYPLSSVVLSIFMLSLAGFPSTIGFLGKFYIFTGAIASGLTWLAVLGVLMAFVSIYYYFRVILMLYFFSPGDPDAAATEQYPVSIPLLLFAALAVLWGGIGSGLFSNFLPGADVITELSRIGIESVK